MRKQNTGIGQVSANFIKKLAEFPISNFLPNGISLEQKFPNNKGMEFILYLEEDVDLELPANFQKKVFLPHWKRDDLIRKIWWEKISLPAHVEIDQCDVLLSLYQNPTVLNGDVVHVMIVHDIIPRLFPEYLNNWRKKMYQKMTESAIVKAGKIIAVSHRTEKDLIQHLGIAAGKITVNYIDADEIYKQEVSKEKSAEVMQKYKLESGYIYNGGGLEVRKNTKSVIEAYKFLLDTFGEHESWLPKLVISGKLMPELAPLVCDAQQLVEDLELEKYVSLLGHVEQEDLPALYKNASVFVYPSHYEGFGLPVLEAMSQGAPVITSKTSSLPEVGSDAVLYCKPDDTDDLAMVLKNVLTNHHLHETLSKRGKSRAENFSWEKFVGKTVNIINELTK